jgi:hypothetical protein
MGRADNPVRNVLNYASDHFLRHLPIVYVLTVVGRRADGGLAVRGLFIGDDIECFNLAAELSLKVNFEIVDRAYPQRLSCISIRRSFTVPGLATRRSIAPAWRWPTMRS